MYLGNIWNRITSQDYNSKELDDNAAIVAASFKNTKTSKRFIPLLTENLPLVMISKAGMGDNIQITSCHVSFGSSLITHKKSLLGLAGFQAGAPIELETSDISKFSTNSSLPEWDSLIQVSSMTDLEAVTPSDNRSDKVRNVAILIPKLSKELLKTSNFQAKEVLLHLIRSIQNMVKTETEITMVASENPDASEDEINALRATTEAATKEAMMLDYYDMLQTLWKIAYDPSKIDPVHCMPISDPNKLKFLRRVLGIQDPQDPTIQTMSNPLPPNITELASSMNRVAQAWEKEISRKENVDKENNDKNKKCWDNLSDVQKQTILLASMSDILVPPETPTTTMLMILKCGTGSRAQTLLHYELRNHKCIVHIDPGCASAIKNGLFLSQPTESHINNFGPAFTPPSSPLSSSKSFINNLRIEEQASHGRISLEDIDQMTTQTVSFPKSYSTLKHTVKNFMTLCGILFRFDSIITTSLAQILNHLDRYEHKYQQCFLHQWFFGGAFIDRIHVRVQLFLQSCGNGNPQDIDIDALDFTDMLTKIQFGEYTATTPAWLDAPDTGKRESGSEPSGGGKRARIDTDNQEKDILQSWERGARLQSTESFQKVFHIKNKLGLQPPMASDGLPLCHRYFATGQCLKNCKRSHAPLTEDSRKAWKNFIDHCRKNYAKFTSGNSRTYHPRNQFNNNPDPTPTKTHTGTQNPVVKKEANNINNAKGE